MREEVLSSMCDGIKKWTRNLLPLFGEKVISLFLMVLFCEKEVRTFIEQNST